MKIKVNRFDKTIPLPSYKTDGAACMDVYSREDVTIKPNSIGYIPLNIALEVPKGSWVMLAARSSTHKLGLINAAGIGIGDWDFKGDNDEYNFIAYNFTKKTVVVEKGTRIGQIMVVKYEKVEIQEVDKLESKDRGGIGTTGFK